MSSIGDAESRDVTPDDGKPLCTTDDVQSRCDETVNDGQSTNEGHYGGMYSITCIQRPLRGSSESGLLWQVVFKCSFY